MLIMRTSFKLFPPLFLFIIFIFLSAAISSAEQNSQPAIEKGASDTGNTSSTVTGSANTSQPSTEKNSGSNSANSPVAGNANDFASDIAVDRLKEFTKRDTEKIDTKRPHGAFIIPPTTSAIPGPAIVSDAGAASPLVGSSVTYHIADGFSFGNGNISAAELEWVAEASGARTFKKTTQLVPQGGTLSNFGHAFFEVKSPVAAVYKVSFKIKYKIFGLNAEFTANAQPVTITFVSGAAVDANPKDGMPDVTISTPGCGGDTPANLESKKLLVDFTRANALQEAGLKEDTSYTWVWNKKEADELSAKPAAVHKYLRASIKRGSDIESDAETGINSTAYSQLSENDRGSFIECGDTYYKRSGIKVEGSGPVPGSLKPVWTVRYPSSSLNAGKWNTAYNLNAINKCQLPTDFRSDNFSFTPTEPTEPFSFEIGMKIKHKWREYKYDNSRSQIKQAIEYAKQLPEKLNAQANSDPDRRGDFVPATTATNQINVSGGEGERGSAISVVISNKCVYKKQYYKEVNDGGGGQIGRGGGGGNDGAPQAEGNGSGTHRVEDGPPRDCEIKESNSFGCGKTTCDDPDKDQDTDPCLRHEMVLDTTAPKITFDGGTIGNGQGDVCSGSGDLVLVKVEISDNNLYSPLSTPYLTYETAPSGGAGVNESWSAVPLQMESVGAVPDNNAARPYPANSGKFQTLVPVPYNIKGIKAIRWFVDAFDGAKAPHTPEFHGAPSNGNHNHGNFWTTSGGHDGNTHDTHEVPENIKGTISVYDNDRPNIDVRMWKVDRSGVYLVGEFLASEDYFVEDCYYQTNDPKLIDNTGVTAGTYSGFKGSIPTDLILTAGYQPAFPATSLFTAAKKQKVVANLDHQCEKSDKWFDYEAGAGVKSQNGNCPVVFEDVKYIFTVDAADNIEAVVNSGARTDIPKVERTLVTFDFQDRKDINISSAKMEFVPGQRVPKNAAGGAVHWYLGPEDPSIPVADPTMLPMEVPTFEYVFHSVSKADDVRRMKLDVEDCVGHHREINIKFKISEVTNELRILEEKVKRELKRDAKQ